MSKLKKFILVIICFIILLTSVSIFLKVKYDNIKFNGVVKSVHYEYKGLPTVEINGKSYLITRGDFKIGDSLIKERGNREIKQYRNGYYMRTFK